MLLNYYRHLYLSKNQNFQKFVVSEYEIPFKFTEFVIRFVVVAFVETIFVVVALVEAIEDDEIEFV